MRVRPWLVAGLLVSLALLTACGGAGGHATPITSSGTQVQSSTTTATLSSLQVSPAAPSMPLGSTQQFSATGTYSDGSTKDLTASVTWSSSNNGVASISNAGLATAAALGTATITATSGSASATASVTVTPAVLASIVVSPGTASIGIHQEQAFTAQGFWTDGSNQDITSQVTWASSSDNVSILSAGLVFAVASTGNSPASITASLNDIVGAATLTVTSATLSTIDVAPDLASINTGGIQQFTALGTWTDLSSQDVTANPAITWSETDLVGTNVASVGEHTGLATGLNEGTANITASDGNVSGSGSLIVFPAAVISIDVSPHAATVTTIQKQQFTAAATFSDGSTGPVSVTWASSDPSVATVDQDGMATPLQTGTALITATCGPAQGCATPVTSNQAVLTVSGANLLQIIVVPVNQQVGPGATVQFAAWAHFDQSGGSVPDADITNVVTWTSSNSAVATISAAGVASAVGLGQSTISATFGAVSGSTVLTVVPEPLLAVLILPANVDPRLVHWTYDSNGLPEQPPLSMTPHTRMQLKAYGYYGDGSFQNLPVAWYSPPPRKYITMTGSGFVIAKRSSTNATVTITATPSGSAVVGTAQLSVYESISSFTVTPSSATVAAGTGVQFTATGANSLDLTTVVHWSTGGITCATISSSGFAKGLLPGGCSVTVTATYYNQIDKPPVTETASLFVSTAQMTGITISPANPTIPLGQNQQLTATGSFDDNTTQDLTQQVSWVSSDVGVVVMSSTTPGLAVSSGTGTASVSASMNGQSATTSVLVTLP